MKRLANSRNCFVCGVDNKQGLHLVLDSDHPGHVIGRIAIPKPFEGWPGMVHGGILSALLDEAGGRSADTNVYPSKVMVTGSINIRYRKPTPVETPLILEGNLIEQKGRVIRTTSKILNEKNEILVEADAVYIEIEQPLTEEMHREPKQFVIVVKDAEDKNDC